MRVFLLIRLSIIALIINLCVVAIAGVPGQKSSKEDLDRLVKATHILESDPIGKDAKKIREWALYFVIQAPDIHVKVCTDYLGGLYKSKNPYESELITQETISMAGFIAENPDKASDAIAVHQAGIEGVLKGYEAILKTKPKAHSEFLDGLIAKRDKGELKTYVEQISTTKCKGKS